MFVKAGRDLFDLNQARYVKAQLGRTGNVELLGKNTGVVGSPLGVRREVGGLYYDRPLVSMKKCENSDRNPKVCAVEVLRVVLAYQRLYRVPSLESAHFDLLDHLRLPDAGLATPDSRLTTPGYGSLAPISLFS